MRISLSVENFPHTLALPRVPPLDLRPLIPSHHATRAPRRCRAAAACLVPAPHASRPHAPHDGRLRPAAALRAWAAATRQSHALWRDVERALVKVSHLTHKTM